ncbi:MAG: S24 family peptidase [Moraxellaceae bacterium]
METIADRLARKMKELGFSQYRLWKVSGVSQPTIKRILDRESKSPDKKTVEALAAALGTSYSELYDGAPATNVSTLPRPIRAWDGDEELGNEYVTIPRLDLRASCGNGNVTWHIDEKGQPQAFRRAWCDRLGIDTTHSATIVADGDSMADRIQDGDSLVVDPTKKQLLDGKVYLICFDGEHFVKRIFKVPGVGLRVVSDNPDKVKYPDWEIPFDKAESLIIMGRVMGVSGGL